MQPVRTLLPEFDPLRPQHKTPPILRLRNYPRKLRLTLPHHLLQHDAALKQAALPRHRSPKLATPRPAMEVLLRLRCRKLRDTPLHPNLPPERLPVKTHSRLRILTQFAALPALDIRIKTKPAFIHPFHQHHPHRRRPCKVAVANATAFGSFNSLDFASSNQLANTASGSEAVSTKRNSIVTPQRGRCYRHFGIVTSSNCKTSLLTCCRIDPNNFQGSRPNLDFQASKSAT